MSSSSIKRLLRSARECLGRREFRDALQHCKEALAEDKSCYEAYIYVGKAAFHLQEYTQAEAAYRRAADLDARNPLAWQGLAELATETGAWSVVADTYSRLLALADAAAAEDPLRGRRATFRRRFAEAAARGGYVAEAEAAWRELVETAAEALAEAEAAGGGEEERREAGPVAEAETELVDCLCRLADVQLAADSQELEVRVAAMMATVMELTPPSTPEQASALESAVRAAAEAEWTEEALELDADHASATLRRIIALRQPSPPYVPYYDAFLKRLRKYIQAAPPGSMDRHSRRTMLLAAAKATMEGRCGDRSGGCCSPYPYEAALAMLEVEHEVVGSEDPSLDPANPSPSLEPPPLPLLVADSGRISALLSHAFPWLPAAQMHTALRLRRRAAVAGFGAAGDGAGGRGGDGAGPAVVRLPPAVTAAGGAGGSCSRRRQVTAMLLSALAGGCRGVSGWLAACELLLEEGAAEAALDAAKEGLKYVAHRDLVGKERLTGAGLLLRLMAGQALLRLRKTEEAQLLLEGLATGVSEGHVASGELAGMPPRNISQQAKRLLAHVCAARGDYSGCRQRFDELVGGQLMGRSAAPIEAWAHGDLGLLLLRQGGTMEGARFHLQAALTALQPALEVAAATLPPAATALTAVRQEAATYQLHLALALWAKGGGTLPPAAGSDTAVSGGGGDIRGPVSEPYRTDSRELLLLAAATAGPLQAAAFTWLGHWYGKPPAVAVGEGEPAVEAEGGGYDCDAAVARRCYQRALALDPLQAEAGEALVAYLVAAGRPQTAVALCEEMRTRIAAVKTSTPSTTATATGGGVSPAVAALSVPYTTSGSSSWPLGMPPPDLIYPGLMPAAAEGQSASPAGGGADWALRCLARLQRDASASEAAVTSYQSALRLDPQDAELWEGLAASYQALGRHTAALKSYGRALELAPSRLFSRLQAASLYYQMGNMPCALSYYRTALAAAPTNPAALLGCGEVLLAQAALAARMGAAGAAAAELAEAEALAEATTRQYGNMQAGWKLLADVRMQHAVVPPLEAVAAARAGSPSSHPTTNATAASTTAVQNGMAAARQRLARLRSAGRAYAAALHGDPRVAGLWGDLGMCCHLQLELAGQHSQLEAENSQAGSPSAAPSPSATLHLRTRALALARGGLRLAPASDWLWATCGTIAAAGVGQSPALAGAAEYCLVRALQLNARRAPVWVALGRLYAANGEGAMASRCFDAGRSHEPTSVAVWEAMGDAALRGAGLNPDLGAGAALVADRPRAAAGLQDAMDAYEHAQLLGGDVESRLGYVLGSLVFKPQGAAAEGSVLAAASKAVALQPLLAAGHHARGLALEARGDHSAAVQAHQTALLLLESDGFEQPTSAACPRPRVLPHDPQAAPSARLAVQLDLARALAASGRTSEAISFYDKLRQEGALRDDDYGTKLSYSLALVQAGRSAEALPHLTALLSNNVAPVNLRLTAANAVVRIHIAARRWDEAYGTVLAVTTDLPEDEMMMPSAARVAPASAGNSVGDGGVGRVSEAAARLWRVLLAGLVASRAPELESELLRAMRGWAATRRDLDGAQHECRVHELLCAKHRSASTAASGTSPSAAAHSALAALRQAAHAVHACPTNGAARALLAHTAVLAPGHAALGARAAPRDGPSRRHVSHTSTGADMGVRGCNWVPGVWGRRGAGEAPLVPSAAAAHASSVVTAAAAVAAAGVGGGGGAAATLLAALREAAGRMRRVVRGSPHETSGWYLCALTELQLAIACGGPAHAYRAAAVAARAAASRAKAELEALPAESAVGPQAGTALPRAAPPGFPPAMVLMLAAQAARAHSPAATEPAVATLRTQRAALADVCVRCLAVVSECHLQLRGRGGGRQGGEGAMSGRDQLAREAAEEALRIAGQYGGNASPAHRQLARWHALQGDMAASDAAYEQAVRAAASSTASPMRTATPYDILPVLEWAAVRATTGRTAEALEILQAHQQPPKQTTAPSTRITSELQDVAAIQRALLLLQLGEVEAARAVAAELLSMSVAEGVESSMGAVFAMSPGLRAAAHTVQSAAAFLQASLAASADSDGGGGDGSKGTVTGTATAARKKRLLEARWAAREALKPHSQSRPAGVVGRRGSAPPPGPSGPAAALAALLAGLAESGLGREDAAQEQQLVAARLWPRTSLDPPEAFDPAASTTAAASAAAAAPPSAWEDTPLTAPARGSGQATGGSGGNGGGARHQKVRLAYAVHCRPWALGVAWGGLVAATRAQ